MKISTGIDPLDRRIGGLKPSRFYIWTGPPGAGKTTAGLQFIGAGLARGEQCAILTQDDPHDLVSQAEFLGFDLDDHLRADRLTVLRYRLDFLRNLGRIADTSLVTSELDGLLGETSPDRFLIDSAAPFLEGGRASDGVQDGLADFLDELDGTTYMTVPGNLDELHQLGVSERLISGAGGVFDIENREGRERALSIRKIRAPVDSTEPITFDITPGVGVVEASKTYQNGTRPPLGSQVVLIREHWKPDEGTMSVLEDRYDLRVLDSVFPWMSDILTRAFGVLLVGIDPMEPEIGFDLVKSLRAAGCRVPILYLTTADGLRSTDRARGLRAGGDGFVMVEVSPEELIEIIELARARGLRDFDRDHEMPVTAGELGEEEGASLLDDEEFTEVVLEKMEKRNQFFSVLLLRVPDRDPSEAWNEVSRHVRSQRGDRGAVVGDDLLALYLEDAGPTECREIVSRLTSLGEQYGNIVNAGMLLHSHDSHRLAPGPDWSDVAGKWRLRSEEGQEHAQEA